jgi:hypothetical protein
MKNVIKNFSASVIAILLLMGTAMPAGANNDKNKEIPAVEFRYIGNLEKHPMYQLAINNPGSEEYFISFSDQSGNVLYSGTTRGGSFHQRFLINIDEVGNETLTVTISSRKNNKSHVYTIKRSQNLVEENVVTRIK